MPVNGTTGLFFLPVETTMNAQRNTDLLKNKLELHMTVHNCTVFMQDGAPCHRAKIVTQFLKAKKIQMLDWPAKQSGSEPNRNFMDSFEEQSFRKITN